MDRSKISSHPYKLAFQEKRSVFYGAIVSGMLASLALSACAVAQSPSEKCLTFPVSIGEDRGENSSNIRGAVKIILTDYLNVPAESLNSGVWSGAGEVSRGNMSVIAKQKPARHEPYPTDIVGMKVVLENAGDPGAGGLAEPWTKHTTAIDTIDSNKIQHGVKQYDCTTGTLLIADFARLN